MSDFNINIYNEVSNDYKKYNKDKNLTISNMLRYIKNNNMRILYINHLDLYINNINIQKETIEDIKNNIDNYDLESNILKIYINQMLE